MHGRRSLWKQTNYNRNADEIRWKKRKKLRRK